MSLARRLREAALERARLTGSVVDGRMLDEDGVIDLRGLDDEGSVAAAAALGETEGLIASAASVSELYDESDAPARRWPFGRRVEPPRPRPTAPLLADGASTTARLSALPLSTDLDGPDREPAIDLTRSDEPEIDLTPRSDDEIPASPGRPATTARCPECGEAGRQDLFDPFNRIEFFSCDPCRQMWQVTRGDA